MALENGFKNGIIKAIQNMKSEARQFSEYKEYFWTLMGERKLLMIRKYVQADHPDRWECYICKEDGTLPETYYQTIDWNNNLHKCIDNILEYLDETI